MEIVFRLPVGEESEIRSRIWDWQNSARARIKSLVVLKLVLMCSLEISCNLDKKAELLSSEPFFLALAQSKV